MDRDKKQFAWWYYFWFLAALSAISPFFGPLDAGDWATWVFEIIGLVGLWAYLRRRPVGSRHLWSAYLIAAVLITFYGGFKLAYAEAEWRGLLIGVLVVALVISFPLFLALWRYAFRSPDIWRASAGAA